MPTRTKRGNVRTLKPKVSTGLPAQVQQAPSGDSGISEAFKHLDSLPDSAYVRQPIVEALFSISATSVWRWVNSSPPRLPRPRKFGSNHTAFNVGELRKTLRGELQ